MEKLFDPRNSKIKNIFPTLSSIVNYASFKPGSKEIRGKWWSYKKLGQGCHSILKIKFQDIVRGFNIYFQTFQRKNHDLMTSVRFFQDFFFWKFQDNFRTIFKTHKKSNLSFKCEREQRTQSLHACAYQGMYMPCAYCVLVMVCTSNGCVQVTIV